VAPVPATVLVRTCDDTSPTLAYAADRIVTELRTVHGLQARVDANRRDPFESPATESGLIVLGQPAKSKALAKWCRTYGLKSSTAAAHDGYHIIAQAKPWRVAIAGDTDLGAWYGGCAWLDSLRNEDEGTVSAPLGEVHDAPALAVRFTRGLGGPEYLTHPEQAIPSLDWWARWRMNVAHVGPLPEPALKAFLAEAHKRGIRVVRGLGVRNLCAADDQAVAGPVEEFRRFLQAGGDGVSALWDDLPHDRCRGHCDRCRERFGTNGLPQEIVHVLEALGDVASQSPAHPLVLWCPPHYSENRYKELPDTDFFRVIGSSERVRRQTTMYYCEFAPEKDVLLDQAGITNRVWWYNGLRTVYHVCHHWPGSPDQRLNIPGLKSFSAPDFARFEVGWKTGIGVRSDGAVLPPPDRTWQDLRSLPARFQGYYPCTASHPYHAAVSGLFAFAPRGFDQAAADRVVFRAMFGPGCEQPARAWSDAYVHFQVWLAQTAHIPLTDAQRTDAQQRLADWRACSREVQGAAAKGHSLLGPAILDSVMARMKEAEDSVDHMLSQRTGGEVGKPTERPALKAKATGVRSATDR
jgi:hypothetical protein